MSAQPDPALGQGLRVRADLADGTQVFHHAREDVADGKVDFAKDPEIGPGLRKTVQGGVHDPLHGILHRDDPKVGLALLEEKENFPRILARDEADTISQGAEGGRLGVGTRRAEESDAGFLLHHAAHGNDLPHDRGRCGGVDRGVPLLKAPDDLALPGGVVNGAPFLGLADGPCQFQALLQQERQGFVQFVDPFSKAFELFLSHACSLPAGIFPGAPGIP